MSMVRVYINSSLDYFKRTKSSKTRLLLIVFLICTQLCGTAQHQTISHIETVLQKAGANRRELENALSYFSRKEDSMQLKAMQFLIANMDIHSSYSYYWADSLGRRVPFNELAYPDFDSSIRAFQKIKALIPKIKPVAYAYKDIDSIKAKFLIENVQEAFKAWKSPWAKHLDFNAFCEYLLPYRASVEPLQPWRNAYQQKFAWIQDSANGKTIDEALIYLGEETKTWFTNSYNIENRKEPLPRLGALQLLNRKTGPCEDIADLAVFALRSQGIPATNDMVSYWATSTGSHFFNSTINAKGEHTRFDISTSTVRLQTFAREPAKVIRTTYAKQPSALVNFEAADNIPKGFLRTPNYLDVTAEYWPVRDITCKLLPNNLQKSIVYACVFNGFQWRPTWWGKAIDGNVLFTNMSKGAAYLPVYYVNGKIVPAGYPVASGYEHEAALKPDTLHKRSITLKEQESYLKFRPGHLYKLLYWDNAWKLIGQQIANDTTKQMLFDNVPSNALLLMYPDNTNFKERPFMVTNEGQRVWW